MKKVLFGFLLLTLAAAGKDHEYKAAILVSQGSVSTGTHCSSSALAIPVGVIGMGSGSASCGERFRRIYHVSVDGYDYLVAPDGRDPLAKVRPGDEIQYRLDDKNHLWTPGGLGYKATGFGRKMYEAKYNVLNIGPKQEDVRNSDAVKTPPASAAALAKTGHERAALGARAPQASRPNTREQRISVLGITAKNGERGGAEIVEVEAGSVAEGAYLHVGDIINSLDGTPVKDSAQLDALLSNRQGEREVRLGYLYRSISFGYVQKDTSVTLGISY